MADPVALLTDFGTLDPYVGIMKGVILSITPSAPLVDLTHAIPPQDIRLAALHLDAAWRHFPDRTVFLCVVDPGVGTTRRPIVARVGERRFVGPDNGLFSLLPHPEVREITADWGLPTRSRTFHGRDLFAPVAARLAGGASFADVGPHVAPVILPFPAPAGDVGEVLYVDRYGNSITNLPGREHGELHFGTHVAPVRRSYGEADVGALLALTGSTGRLELAVRNGSAAATYGLGPGSRVAWRP